MTKKGTLKKSAKLESLLVKAHKMLSDIAVPVQPFEKYVVRTENMGRVRHAGHCSYTAEGKILVTVTDKCAEEKGDMPLSLSIILHEMIHSCCGEDDTFSVSHDGKFMEYANLVKSTYNIDVREGGGRDAFKYSTLPARHIFTCPDCGAVCIYRDPEDKEWHEAEEKMKQGKVLKCAYCGAKMKNTK